MFKADVETAILNVHMKDGDVVHAKPPPEWQPETLDPSKGTVIGKLQKSLCGLRSAPRRWQDHAASSRTCWTLACGHTTKRVSLVFHVDDLLLAGTHQMIKEIHAAEPELKSNEVTTKPTRYLGRTFSNMSALRSSPTLRWERREKDEKEMPASEQRAYRQLVGTLPWIDRADFIKSWTRERHGHEKHQTNPAIPPWKPWNHDSAADDTQSGSCEKSSCGLSVDV